MSSVAITGFGVVSAAGSDRRAFARALFEGRSAIGEVVLPRAFGRRAFRAAQIGDLPGNAAQTAGDRRAYDRFSVLALLAAEEAVAAAGLDAEELAGARTSVLLGTGIGGATSIDDSHHGLYVEQRRPDPFTIPRLMAHAAPALLSRRWGCRGTVLAISSACASGAQAIGLGMSFIRAGLADRVLAGGTEASLTPSALAELAGHARPDLDPLPALLRGPRRHGAGRGCGRVRAGERRGGGAPGRAGPRAPARLRHDLRRRRPRAPGCRRRGGGHPRRPGRCRPRAARDRPRERPWHRHAAERRRRGRGPSGGLGRRCVAHSALRDQAGPRPHAGGIRRLGACRDDPRPPVPHRAGHPRLRGGAGRISAGHQRPEPADRRRDRPQQQLRVRRRQCRADRRDSPRSRPCEARLAPCAPLAAVPLADYRRFRRHDLR